MHTADAVRHHARGIECLQLGRPADAVQEFQRAVQLAPGVVQYLANLAEAHRRAAAPERGAEYARRAVAIEPGYLNGWINLGCCLFGARAHAEALAAFDRAAQLAPNDGAVLAFRGDALRELGRIREAIVCYEHAIACAPALAHAYTNLGPLLLAVGRNEEAIQACRRAIELAPGVAEPMINLGRCLFGLDRLDDAMDAYAAARDIAPDSALLAHNIAQVWQESADVVQAVLWYDKALALDSQHLESRIQLAALKTENGVIEEALSDLRSIVAEHPQSSEAQAALARAWWDDGDAGEAVVAYDNAIALQPEAAHLRAQLGQVLASSGDVPAALDAYRSALATNPNCISALYGLAIGLGKRLETEHFARITSLLGNQRLHDGARSMLHNGLAHYFDSIGDFDAAAEHAASANALQWRHKRERGWRYDPQEYARRIDQLIAHFTPEYFRNCASWGLDDQTPVFVVGMPRSGTTLTEQILASHPQVLGVGERPYAMRGFDRWMAAATTGASTPPGRQGIREAAHWHLGELARLVQKSGRDPAAICRVVDKMPDNYSLLGWLVSLFPRARIIHCRRDSRDVAVSCWLTQFSQIEWACQFEHLAARVHEYRRMMEHWRRVLPVPMLEIDYESLVADQERVSRRLVQFLGLEWDPACLAFQRGERLVRTASVTQVRQAIYTSSVARWRRYEAPLASLFAAIDG